MAVHQVYVFPTCAAWTQSSAKHDQARGKGDWQRRLWEHMIRGQDNYDLYAHLIATAPVRAGLIRDGSEWPLCSAYKRRMRFNAPIRTTDQVPSGLNQAIAANATRIARSYASETS